MPQRTQKIQADAQHHIRLSPGICARNCQNSAPITAYANAHQIACLSDAATSSAAVIDDHVQQHGRRRGQRELSIRVEHANTKEVSEMKIMYGNMILVMVTARRQRGHHLVAPVPMPSRRRSTTHPPPRRAKARRAPRRARSTWRRRGPWWRRGCFVLELGENRHEGLRECSLADRRRNKFPVCGRRRECVGEGTGAKCARDQCFADQAGHARQQR